MCKNWHFVNDKFDVFLLCFLANTLSLGNISIAGMAHSFGIAKSVRMLAVIGFLISAEDMIALVAQALGVMLSRRVITIILSSLFLRILFRSGTQFINCLNLVLA